MEIRPYLTFNGNANDAIDLYKKAFNTEVINILNTNSNLIEAATLKLGDSLLQLSDSLEDYSNQPFTEKISLIIHGDAKDIERAFNTLKHDGEIITDLEETADSPKAGVVIDSFGIRCSLFSWQEAPKKKYAAKPRHKWTKEISQINFYANNKNATGTVIWKKTKELVLLSGANINPDPALNKDGSKNYAAIFAEKVRSDHKNQIKNFTTTEDIIFPSPHVLGMFLFYGGQDTWKELIDENGKSLNDWSVVK